MDTCLVKFRDVYKYDVKKAYNFEINKGDCVLISGENGQGKTTLTKLILGYIRPDQGLIEKKHMQIGYLPEHISFPWFMKVNRYLERLSMIKQSKAYDQYIYLFEIPLFKTIYELSKGNRQKLGIISACIGKPDMIILDEPLSTLDEKGREQFYDMIASIKNEEQAVIIITHFPSFLKPLCNKHIAL
ncbi:ATP-binding cassette domain-containing protein [Mycoplasmatota bacterium]|nr:ATP-binding cassette domain-containing protein [Mycoplasmatota bacterium]